MGKNGRKTRLAGLLFFSSFLPPRPCVLQQGECIPRAAEARRGEPADHHCWWGSGGSGCPPGILHLAAEE